MMRDYDSVDAYAATQAELYAYAVREGASLHSSRGPCPVLLTTGHGAPIAPPRMRTVQV